MFTFIKDKNPLLHKKFIGSMILIFSLVVCNIMTFFYIASSTKQAKTEFYNAQEMQLWLDKYHEENIEQTTRTLPAISEKNDIQLKAVEISTLLREGNNVINISNKDVIATKEDLNSKNITAVFNAPFNNIVSTLNRLETNHNLLSVESFTLDNSNMLPLVTLSINLYFK